MSKKTENVNIKEESVDEIDISDAEHDNLPNIICVGKRHEPPTKLTDGSDVFQMPKAAEQLKGFYHPKAAQIVRAFPRFYKRFVEAKGEMK